MTLSESAYLEIEGDSTTATFEFRNGLQIESALEKRYLMAEQGQYIREVVNQTPGTGDFDADRRTGFWLDGGGGDWQIRLDFRTGQEDIQWGDGESSTGQSNVTTTDASGQNVKHVSRMQVLQYWLSKSKSDSGGATRLHWGEWTDGSIANVDSSSIAAGAFDQPMPVAIRDDSVSLPDPDDGPVWLDGSITMSQVALWGGYDAPDWLHDAVGAATNAADVIPDA